jgi:hypothetical protein
MNSYQTITLFTERRDSGQNSLSLLASVVVHMAVIGVIILGITSAPKIHARNLTQKYTVRNLDLESDEPKANQEASGYKLYYPAQSATAGKHQTKAADSSASAAAAAPSAGWSRLVAQAAQSSQTLLQPEIESKMTLAESTPIPSVLLWSKDKAQVKQLVAPQPTTTAAEIQPAVDPPNEEINVADMAIASTNLATQIQPFIASKSSPVVVHGPDKQQTIPETTSKTSATPTPAAVLAVSNLSAVKGTVSLPPVNQKSASASSGHAASRHADESHANATAGTSLHGSGTTKSGNAGGAGHGEGNHIKSNFGSAGNQGGHGGSPSGKEQTTGNSNGSGGQTNPGNGTAHKGFENHSSASKGTATDEPADQSRTTRITLPKTGRFGAVILGDSLKQVYPETVEIWGDRLAYTVYLHVGTIKSWILQYSLPSTAVAAAGGNIARLDSPWPYNIVRPNVGMDDIDGDALLVHGFIDIEGHFENLAVAFPANFPQKQFVLNSINQWQFRPAAQNGQPVRVEVLLIIPTVQE